MPMIDFRCLNCGFRFENFFHSDPPEFQSCPHQLEEGVCNGQAPQIRSMPGEYRPTNARRFEPIVLWVSNEDSNQVSIPGHAHEPVQEGYHKVEITDLVQADYWTRKIDAHEREKAQFDIACQKAYWDQVTQERRDTIRARIRGNPRAEALFRAAQQYVDAKRERKYSGPVNPNVHFQVVSFDASNRPGYVGPETQWRERKD